MNEFSGFASGFMDRGDENLRRRQEMAQAFATFRAANPNASAREYQDFIDSFSGGRNYIAGGAPSSDVLRSIEMEGQRRRAQEQARSRLASIRERQATIESLQSLADQYLLSMEGDDYATARDSFADQFGADGSALFSDLDINSLFTPGRREALIGRQIRENLPSVISLARETDGQVTSADLARAFPGLPRTILDPLVEQARNQYGAETAERERARALEFANAEAAIRTSIINNPRFQTAIRRGDQAGIDTIISSTLRPYQALFPESFDADFRTGIVEEVSTLAEAEQVAEHQRLYASSVAAQQEAVTNLDRASQEAVNRAFRASENGAPSQLTGRAGAMGLLAAQELSRIFDASSPAAIDALASLFQQDAVENASMEQIIAMGAEALQAAGVQTMDGARQSVRLGAGATIPEMTPFPDWRQSIEEEVYSDIAELEQDIRRAQNIQDPQELQAWIIRIERSAAMARQQLSRTVADARANSNLWVPVGSPGWDEAAVSGGPGSVMGIMDAELGRLGQQLQTLEALQRRLAEQAEVEAAAPVQQISPLAPSGLGPVGQVDPSAPQGQAPAQTGFQRSAVGQFITSEREQADAARMLLEARGRLARGGDLPGTSPLARITDFFSTPTENPEAFATSRQEAQELQAVLGSPEARQFLLENRETATLLQEDPVAWARLVLASLEAQRGTGR